MWHLHATKLHHSLARGVSNVVRVSLRETRGVWKMFEPLVSSDGWADFEDDPVYLSVCRKPLVIPLAKPKSRQAGSGLSLLPRHVKRRQYWLKQRLNPRTALINKTRALVRRSLLFPNGKTLNERLGYTATQLKTHLIGLFKAGMTWEAVLDGRIHIDHIRPICKWEFTIREDHGFKACWDLSNLQPLWAEDNLKKRIS